MPNELLISNDKEGNHLENKKTQSLEGTILQLQVIGNQIFRQNKKKHYLALSLENMNKVSYAEKEEDKYSRIRRRQISIMRYITRNFPESSTKDINEKGLEIFSDKFVLNSAQDIQEYFWIEKGMLISQRYEQGFGAHTCMTDSDANLTRMWSESDQCELLLFDNGKHQARALLWTADNGKKFLDRIYPNSGQHIEFFKEYCRINNIARRNHQDYPESQITDDYIPKTTFTSGETYSVTFTEHTDMVPYMDSLHWGYRDPDEEEHLITYTNPEDTKSNIVLASTCGDTHRFRPLRCIECSTIIFPHSTAKRITNTSYVYCPECYTKTWDICDNCGDEERKTALLTITTTSDTSGQLRTVDTEKWCRACGRDTKICTLCEKRHTEELLHKAPLYTKIRQNAINTGNTRPTLVCNTCLPKLIINPQLTGIDKTGETTDTP